MLSRASLASGLIPLRVGLLIAGGIPTWTLTSPTLYVTSQIYDSIYLYIFNISQYILDPVWFIPFK